MFVILETSQSVMCPYVDSEIVASSHQASTAVCKLDEFMD